MEEFAGLLDGSHCEERMHEKVRNNGLMIMERKMILERKDGKLLCLSPGPKWKWVCTIKGIVLILIKPFFTLLTVSTSKPYSEAGKPNSPEPIAGLDNPLVHPHAASAAISASTLTRRAQRNKIVERRHSIQDTLFS